MKNAYCENIVSALATVSIFWTDVLEKAVEPGKPTYMYLGRTPTSLLNARNQTQEAAVTCERPVPVQFRTHRNT